MSDPEIIKKAFERNRKVIELRPKKAKKTVTTKLRLTEGTTCEVVHKDWTFKVDIGEAEGGNNAGPGPGLLQRGALAGCLAIGYVQQAAIMGVPIEQIEITIEADKDLTGRFGMNNQPPGSKSIRYKVLIESSAPEEEIKKVIAEADHLSPVLDDFKRAIPIEREVKIRNSKKAETKPADKNSDINNS